MEAGVCSLKTRKGGHRKSSTPRSLIVSYSVSGPRLTAKGYSSPCDYTVIIDKSDGPLGEKNTHIGEIDDQNSS